MAAQYGATEVMGMHEVLSCAIDGINEMQLIRPHTKDQQLMQMLDHQLQFMTNEYNNFVQLMNQQGAGQAVPYRAPRNIQPIYGLDNPGKQSPNMSAQQMDDRDVASLLLGIHKSGALAKMRAALECADPSFRRALQQGAVNCSEQAYEVFQYMNQKGYYQVPTMKEVTTQTMMGSYTPGSQNMQPGMMNTMQMPNQPQQMNTMPQ